MPSSTFRLESERLIARCWSPDDTEAFRALLDRNNDHLRPFIPWMKNEPMPMDQTRERLANYERRFMAGEDFRFALLDKGERLIGELMSSTRSGGNTREVGYLVDREMTGKGLATEATLLALRAAFDFSEVEVVELHCSPRNTGSVRIAEKLGFILEEVLPKHSEDSEGFLDDSMRWSLERARFRSTPGADFAMRAFDASGTELKAR